MSKRRAISQETNEALSLTSASSTYITSAPYNSSDNNAKIHVNAQLKRKSKSKPWGGKQVADIVCPTWSIKRYGYGGSFTNTGYDGTITKTSITRAVTWNSSQQNVTEFVHMPRSNKTLNRASYALDELITKGRTDNNFSMESRATTAPIFAAGVAAQELQMCYYGGNCLHTFTNTSNCDISFTFDVFVPRRFLTFNDTATFASPDWSDAQANTYGHLPTQLALVDMQQNVTRTNTAPTTMVYDTTKFDTTQDLAFQFSSNQRLLNYNYTRKTIHKPCAPGQTITFNIKFPGFNFKETDWNMIMSGTGATVQAEFLPFCTVILAVTARGQIAHNDNTTDTIPVTSYSTVGLSAGAYIHTQQEFHKLRSIPFQPVGNTIVVDNRDEDTTMNAHVNEETQLPMAYDD